MVAPTMFLLARLCHLGSSGKKPKVSSEKIKKDDQLRLFILAGMNCLRHELKLRFMNWLRHELHFVHELRLRRIIC